MAKVSSVVPAPAVSISPVARVLRTGLQSLIAYGTSFPALIAWFHLTAVHTAQISGVVSGIVFVASALLNTLEHFNVIPTSGGKIPTTLRLPPQQG